MIALTNRLNERDETIIQLQEELDAYDKIHRETEMNIENKTERVHNLEEYIRENGLEVPQGPDYDTEDPESQNMLGRRYPPYQSDQIGDEDMPMKLMNADEKIEELMQIVEEQKMHMETLEQERTELIDSKADFMSEKINEIVNREVNKELERIRNNPDSNYYEEQPEGEEEDEYEGDDNEAHVERREMEDDENHEDNQSHFSQYSQKEEYGNPMPYNFNPNANKENNFSGVRYPEDYESMGSYKQNASDSHASSYKSSNVSTHDKVYERRLPPNVEEMLKQKRQQMANRLS